MNYKIIGRYLGILLMLETTFLVVPAAISWLDGEWTALFSFLTTMALTLGIGFLFWILCRRYSDALYAKEGLVLVALAWVVLSLFGALPFYFSREIPSFVDSFFEVVSGITTTGASILTDVESMSRGLIFWRSFTHWLGGMGILVFLMALEPSRKGNGFTLHVMRAESPGPSVGKLVPKIRETAKILYAIYIIMTVLCLGFLLAGGMPLFDSLCTAFGTAGTGGFGIKNDGLASYSSYLQTVVAVFMTLFGINFGLYYLFLRDWKSALKDEELRLYVVIVVLATALITWNALPYVGSVKQSLHQAFFHVSSLVTSTGYAISDYNAWPEFSHAVMMLLMFVGACAGSTGGGTKVARLLLLVKYMKAGFKKMLRPNSVNVVTFNGKPVDESVLRGLNVYFAAYFCIFTLSFLVLSLDDCSLLTNFSATLACLNNIGPGLDLVGPASNYSALSVTSKLVLTADMLLGRLEIFPLIALFSPSLYRHKSN